jgi:hypothetical protein
MSGAEFEGYGVIRRQETNGQILPHPNFISSPEAEGEEASVGTGSGGGKIWDGGLCGDPRERSRVKLETQSDKKA